MKRILSTPSRRAGARRLLLWLVVTPVAVYAALFVSGVLWGSTVGRTILGVLAAVGLTLGWLWARR